MRLGLAFAALLATASLAAEEYPLRWFYMARNFGTDADVEFVSNIVARAAKAGYNGMALSANIDSAFAKPNPAREARLRAVRRICDGFGVEIVPMVWSVGYATMLDIDPDCIEALPVKGVGKPPAPPVAIGDGWDVHDRNKSRLRYGKRLKVRPFRHYRFSVKVRTKGLPDGTFMLQVYRKGGEHKYLDLRPKFDGDSGWQEVSIDFNPYDMDEVWLWCGYWGYTGPGEVEVRDARLEDVGFPDRPVRRAGLERRDDTDWMGCPPMKDKWGQRCCCMANPRLYEHFRKSAVWIDDVLKPKMWFLSMDEIRLAGTCAACSGRSLPALLAECLTKQRAAIKAVNPSAEVCVWNDMVDEHHNAHERFFAVNGSFAGALDMLPRDMIIVDWLFSKRDVALKEFSSRGFRTIGAGFYDAPVGRRSENARGWAESLNAVSGALGTMYTTWRRDYSALEEFASAVRENSRPLHAPETVKICDGWRISPKSRDPVVVHAAELLSRFLESEKGVKVPVVPNAAGGRVIAVGVSNAAGEHTSVVQVAAGRVSVAGGTPREAAQGCYRIVDMLRSSKGVEIESGRRTFTRMFSPRMTHSSVSIDSFPDEELDRIAMAGMDAVIVYVGRSPDMTRAGKVDMNDLVRRAALRGLDVYVYAFDAKGAAACDPTAPDAVEQYDRLYGGIVKNAPGLKGMVFVGESAAFASHLPDMGGFYWNREKGRHTFGFWPSLDWVDWLNAVKTALRRHRPDFDVVFWTYNWCAAPEKDRVELVRKIPADVTLLVTFEMGALPERYKGVPLQIDDYSICRPGPSAVFTSEAAVAASRGIKLLAMANTGGRTWDFGGAPYEPAPYAWLDRFRAIREAHEKFGLAGLMDSHHYGWHDGVVADLAKEAFTVENAASGLEAQLYRIAVRRLGAEAAPKALAAWRDWSEAMRLHPADSCDQYGPLRVGPSFPFTMPGEELPKKPKGKWMFLRKDYALPLWRFPAMQELAQREISLWERGISAMDEAAEAASADCRRAVRMEAALGRFCAASVRTMLNFRDFRKAAAASNVVDMVAAIARERENVRSAIPLFDENPSIGREPTMGVVADREHMEWKLRQLDDKERQIVSANHR